MRGYALYVLKRFGQFALVIFIGVSLTFFVTHLTPIDPVEQTISSITAFGDTSPEAVLMMREALSELYGTGEPLLQQYATYWRRLLQLDFGPSLSAFPTPVSELIGRALPWTVALLLTCTLIAWVLGNLLGGLAGYYRRNRTLKVFGMIAMGLHPVPYYIIAFVLLLIFGSFWPVLPISGGSARNIPQGFSAQYILSVLQHSILPAASIILVSIGGWFMGMRALVSNIVTEDYVTYAELGGVDRRRILSFWRQTIFFPFADFSNLGRGEVLRTHIESPTYSASYYDPRGKVDQWYPMEAVPYLKLAAVHGEGGSLTLFALNRHLTEELSLDVLARGFANLKPERATTLTHSDLAAVNTSAAPDHVKPTQLSGVTIEGDRIRATLPPASWSILRFT